jgi:hypothetical protein
MEISDLRRRKWNRRVLRTMIVVLAGAGEGEPVQGLICRKSYAAADTVPARQVIAIRQIGWFDG